LIDQRQRVIEGSRLTVPGWGKKLDRQGEVGSLDEQLLAAKKS